MSRFANTRLILGLVGGIATGCSVGLTPVPSGAQQVHMADTDASMSLQPATVRAGDVYVVLDGPRQSVVLVSQKRTAEATPGPMSDDDLARLRWGDTEGTSTESLSVTCSAEQRAAARGQVGECGNVYRFTLAPGKYAFLPAPPDGRPSGPQSVGPLAILEVSP
jgi:hypothetical protein